MAYNTHKKQNQIILLKHALVQLPDSIIINKKSNTLTIILQGESTI